MMATGEYPTIDFDELLRQEPRLDSGPNGQPKVDFNALLAEPDVASSRAVTSSYVDPNSEAEKLILSRKLKDHFDEDWSPAAINPAEARRRLGIAENERILNDSPILSRKFADQAFANVTHQDLGNLGSLERTVTGTLGDVGVTALKGAVGVPQAIVGLANIPTLGHAGKLLEDIGLDFAETQDILDSMYSPAQQAANKRVQDAQGFVNTLTMALQNPSTILTTAGESLPSMYAGGLLGRGLKMLGAGVLAEGVAGPTLPGYLTRLLGERGASIAAGAGGEGLVTAGQIAEQVRSEDEEGLLSPKAALASLAAGTVTGVISAASGKVAQKLGLGDIDTMIVEGGAKGATANQAKMGFMRQVAGAGISEGVFEELPQSAQEQMWQNWAQDKPITEGVGNAAAMGMLAGVGMGAGGGSIHVALQKFENAKQAETTAQRLNQITQLARASQVLAADPQTFHDFMSEVAQGSEVDTLFVDGRTLAQRISESGVPIEQLEAVMPGLTQQVTTAAALNESVAIPLADFATHIAPTPLADALVPDLRTEGGMSVNEAQTVINNVAEEFKGVIQTLQTTAQQDVAFRKSFRAVRDNLEGQILAASPIYGKQDARAAATLEAARYATLARQFNITPEEALQRFGGSISREGQAPGGPVLSQEQLETPEFKTWFGDSKVVDDQGRPLVVYHGTQYDVNGVFQGNEVVGWFTTSTEHANQYVNNKDSEEDPTPNILPVYLKIDKPLVIDVDMNDDGSNVADIVKELGIENAYGLENALADGSVWEAVNTADFMEAVYRAGYDGVKVKEGGVWTYGVDRPTQIKSAVGNVGTFSPTDANILRQASPVVTGRPLFRDIITSLGLSRQEVKSTAIEYMTGLPGDMAFLPPDIGGLADVVRFLHERRMESGLPVLDIKNEQDRVKLAKLMAAEALAAIRNAGDSLEWYDTTVAKTLSMMSVKYPELDTDPDARNAFLLATAITSQGMNVEDNLKFASSVYDTYRTTGSFPLVGQGESQEAMARNFQKANDLIAELGPENFRRFLVTPFTVRELDAAGYEVGGENKDTVVLGSAVFGPKIGFGFYSNLNGNFEPVTMDMWFMRTVGRLAGTLPEFNREKFDKQIARFREGLKHRGKKDAGLFASQFDRDLVKRAQKDEGAAIELASLVKKAHEKDFRVNRAQFDAGTREKTQMVSAALTMIQSLEKPKDVPSSGGERNNLRDVVARMVDIVSEQYGTRVPPAALQALIWYPEQELYKAMGVKLRVTSQDYAGAARKLLENEGFNGQQLDSAAESGSRRVRPENGQANAGAVQENDQRIGRARPFEAEDRVRFLQERNRLTLQQPNLLRQQDVSQRNFEAFTEGAPVIMSDDTEDYKSGPAVFEAFHATTHTDIRQFKPNIGNREGFLGQGSYFTTSREDASSNYAGEGPDLKGRIALESERILDQMNEEEYYAQEVLSEYLANRNIDTEVTDDNLTELMFQYGEEAAEDAARKQLKGQSEGLIMPVWVKVLNPFDIRPNGGELTLEYETDEDGDIIDGSEKGSALDFIDALNEVGSEWNVDVGKVVNYIYENAIDGVSMFDVWSYASSNLDDVYMDPDGEPAFSGQFLQEVARKAGYDGIVMDADYHFGTQRRTAAGTSMPGMRGVEPGTLHVMPFLSRVQVRSALGNAGTYSMETQDILRQEARGYYDPARMMAILTSKADFSTLHHEMFHNVFNIYDKLVDDPNAPAQIREDFLTMLKNFNVPDLTTWRGMSFEEQRRIWEGTAYQHEIYLSEGKAPNDELKSVFDRISKWIRDFYRDVVGRLNALYRDEFGEDLPALTPEIRSIFDRMFASEQEIARAEQAHGMAPMFRTQEESGMDDATWQAYQAMWQEPTDRAVSDLQRNMIREMLRLARMDIRKTIQREVRDELMQTPVYSAMSFLRKGRRMVDGELQKVEGMHRLDVDVLKDMYGPGSDIDYKQLYFMYSENGLDPRDVASMFGFENADQMVRLILSAPKFNDAVETRTNERMEAEYGELNTPEAIEAKVDEAVHNELRARLITLEYRYLSKAPESVRNLMEAVRQAASEMVGLKKVSELRPREHINAETKAGQRAVTAQQEGNAQDQMKAKRDQMLQNRLAAETLAAKAEVDKILRKFRRLQSAGSQKNMRGEARVQLNNLLARFDLRVSRSLKDIQANKVPLGQFLQSEAERLSAFLPELPEWILDADYRQSYKELTMEQLRELDRFVSYFENLARREQKQYQAVRNQTYKQEVESILAELMAANPRAFDADGKPLRYEKLMIPLRKELKGRFQSEFDAQFVNMENILDVITGGRGKAIFESLFGRLSQAQDERSAFMKRLGNALNEATKAYSMKERLEMTMKKGLVPGTPYYLTRENRIAIALFYGSETGRQRLMDGNRMSEASIQAVLATLDAKDVALIKTIYRLSDEIIWPELKAVNERTAGIAPEKVKALSYMTPHGQIDGGYVPLVYDGEMSARAHDLQTNESVQELLGGTSNVAATQRSASKQRLEKVNRDLSLSLRAIAYKLNETVHDITHREAVADTYRLLQNDGIQHALRYIAGPAVYNMFLERVREVAVKPRTPSGFTEKTFWYLRKNAMINMMGASVNTVLLNVLGVFPAIRRVGGYRFLRAMGQLIGERTTLSKARYDWILAKSKYMKERTQNFDRDLNAELSRLNPSSIMPGMDFWFAGLSTMDRMIAMPTWMAAYEKGMEVNANDEKAAVDYADRVVRQTAGGGRAIDLAKVAGGVGIGGELRKAVTMYMNFFLAQMGMLRRGGALAGREWSAGKYATAAGLVTLDVLLVVVLPAALEAIARGNCGDDPDAEDYLYCAARSSALFVGNFFPIFRDLLPFVWKQFDPDVQNFGVRFTPLESAVETMGRLPKATIDILSGDAEQKDFRDLIRGTGYAFGLPGFQAWRTVDGARALMEGETNNPAVIFTGPPQ